MSSDRSSVPTGAVSLWAWRLVAGAAVAVFGSLAVAAVSRNESFAERISALESQAAGSSARLERIESKLDRLIERSAGR